MFCFSDHKKPPPESAVEERATNSALRRSRAESAQQAEEYMASGVGEAIAQAGIPEPKTTEFEIHNLTEAR